MDIRFVKALWGMEEPAPQAVDRIAAAGYGGFSAVLDGAREVRAAGRDLPAVVLLFPMRGAELTDGLREAADLGAIAVNVHGGKDWFSDDEADRFFGEALEAVAAQSLPVVFETHRGRLLDTPKSTRRALERFPSLNLCADFSHWTVVCESYLDDQAEAVDLAITRTAMIHARVGHPEGPQVPDPRWDRWSGAVSVFEGWWSRMVTSARERGQSEMIVDPEYGPPDYLWTDGNGRPLADLWEVCAWQRDRLERQFKASSP